MKILSSQKRYKAHTRPPRTGCKHNRLMDVIKRECKIKHNTSQKRNAGAPKLCSANVKTSEVFPDLTRQYQSSKPTIKKTNRKHLLTQWVENLPWKWETGTPEDSKKENEGFGIKNLGDNKWALEIKPHLLPQSILFSSCLLSHCSSVPPPLR